MMPKEVASMSEGGDVWHHPVDTRDALMRVWVGVKIRENIEGGG
jgi:hypothetical protein